MSNELVVKKDEIIVKKDELKQYDLSVIEQVVMIGDLAKLTSDQRVKYYHAVCQSLSLNPMTKPFAYISMNGTLQLYAKKDATEQLRSVRNISIVGLSGKVVDDLYIVHAKATMPNGRVDESTGAVSFANLKGEAKANAIMKAETKAKRRVTLSISGLGFVDESEIDSIPHAKRVDVDMQTGDIKEPEKLALTHTPTVAPQTAPPVHPPANEQSPPKPPIDQNAFGEFIARHSLIKNSDGTVTSRKMLYVMDTCDRTNMAEVKVIEYAFRNEALFMERFQKWADQKYPKDQPIQGTREPVGMEVFQM